MVAIGPVFFELHAMSLNVVDISKVLFECVVAFELLVGLCRRCMTRTSRISTRILFSAANSFDLPEK